MADVDVAVGVGRAIVEDELLAPGTRRADLLLHVGGLPFGEDHRLFQRQAGLHRKVGLGQEDSGAVIGLGFGCVGHCGRL